MRYYSSYWCKKQQFTQRTTFSDLRGNINNLETYITMLNSNIYNFNQNVKVNVEVLKAIGEIIYYPITNLF